MASMLLNEIWQLRIGTYTISQAAINTVHYKVTAVLGTVDSGFVALDFDTDMAPLFKALMADNATYRGVSLQRIAPLPKTVPDMVTSSEGPGSQIGEMLPEQTAGIISAKTAFAGRRQRARVYIPFPCEIDNDDGAIPATSYVTRLDNLALELYATRNVIHTPGVNTLTLQPVVYHRLTQTTDDIIVARGKRLWATQKRRGNFGRRNPVPF